MRYSSDPSDAEWALLELLLVAILPAKKQTRPSAWTRRQLIDAMLYQLKSGCNWCDLPKDFPPDSTVYWHYKQWRVAGAWAALLQALHEPVCQQVKKNALDAAVDD